MKSRLKSILRSRLFWIALAVLAVVAGTLVHRYAFMREGVTPSEEEYPVRGIDISSHNGDIDFGALKQAGIDFVLIKASEGSSFKDPRFYTNIARARKAGLKVSAYHFSASMPQATCRRSTSSTLCADSSLTCLRLSTSNTGLTQTTAPQRKYARHYPR